ncbi:hypothetical protein CfE428DRAFT_5653 [Chthoniobacter flavus Ellin428]|uniref:Uncharacterized protein n=1 Tax=Chthoniobacter flavus Ellin428 TaxID=497964 RepID=B4D9R3_9BACT|nr:hypothetical protein [Chthoniobacter flavus]EDY16844.1 hypothetical protein CfE428DRAFT_5653 [Chthoniobacter flavus Ellin428]TCO93333.1 hypothetical protein EV701_10435 [Chthoniobacter flavus]
MSTSRLIPAILSLVTIATVFCAPAVKAERQPRMDAALGDLQAARAKLEHAEHDKGGHREKALEMVNAAIAQIKEGIRYDNRH